MVRILDNDSSQPGAIKASVFLNDERKTIASKTISAVEQAVLDKPDCS